MNKEAGKLYDEFLSYVFKYIPSDGDGRLECEGMLVNLIDNLDNWISVENELPKDRQKVLAVLKSRKGKKIAVCEFEINYKQFLGTVAYGAMNVDRITHWQPSPSPPKE